jgi:hypothetical protein
MKEIVIKTQAEFDALPDKFDEYTRIHIQNDASAGRIIVAVARENSSVVAWGNSSVVARGNSSVVARGNSSVETWENSSVETWGNSSVVARENSSVVAWGNSSVETWENSSVVARGNSSVVAKGNSSVVAWGNVGVHLQSDNASVVLYMFAVCWVLAKGKLTKRSETATIIKPKKSEGTDGWLEEQGIDQDKKQVVLFKRVSSDLKTQETTPNETVWEIGKTITHSAWSPEKDECGAGKFHACSRPYFCDEFRTNKGDKYIAIQIKVKDLYVWPGETVSYPHKIAFREGTVLYVCDKMGKKL